MTSALPTIAILALPEAGASVVYGMYDLFKSAGRDWDLMVTGCAGKPLMNPIVVARQAATFDIANNVRLTPHDTFDNVTAPDIVCVPEVFLAPDDTIDGRFTPEIAWLQRCHAQGAILASACSGALLLAEAGLLDGEEATTHWAFCETLQARHPTIKMRPRNALVASGEGQRLVMAGGGASWFDLALYLIARIAGVEVAMQTARVNLIDWHAAGQQPYAHLARARQSEDALIAGCQVWIAENYQGHRRWPRWSAAAPCPNAPSPAGSRRPPACRRWNTCTRCGWRKPSRCSRPVKKPSRWSPKRSATRIPASSAGCSSARSA
nr:DJ-1/PfpI family protein [Arenimonas daejeonensis]